MISYFFMYMHKQFGVNTPVKEAELCETISNGYLHVNIL